MFDLNEELKNIKKRILLTPEEAADVFFRGTRSAASLRRDANLHRLPFIRLGKRIYFEADTLNNFFQGLAEKSSTIAATPHVDAFTPKVNHPVSAVPVMGISKISVNTIYIT